MYNSSADAMLFSSRLKLEWHQNIKCNRLRTNSRLSATGDRQTSCAEFEGISRQAILSSYPTASLNDTVGQKPSEHASSSTKPSGIFFRKKLTQPFSKSTLQERAIIRCRSRPCCRNRHNNQKELLSYLIDRQFTVTTVASR